MPSDLNFYLWQDKIRRCQSLLLRYLIGRNPFYKVIKDDRNKCVEVKSFNIDGKLSQTVGGVKPSHFADRIRMPSEIVNFRFKPGSPNDTADDTESWVAN